MATRMPKVPSASAIPRPRFRGRCARDAPHTWLRRCRLPRLRRLDTRKPREDVAKLADRESRSIEVHERRRDGEVSEREPVLGNPLLSREVGVQNAPELGYEPIAPLLGRRI